MAFEFNQTNLTNQKSAVACQFSTTSKFKTADEAPAKRVLKVVATPKILNHEQLQDGFTFSGTTFVNIAYVSNGGEIEAIKGQFDWQNKTEALDMSDTTLIPSIDDLEVSVADDNIVINCLLTIKAVGKTSVEVKELAENEDLVTKTENVNLKTIVASGSEYFNINEDFVLPSEVEEILTTKASVIVNSTYPATDVVTVEGSCYVEIFAKTAEDVTTINKQFNFKQEVSCLGAEVGQTSQVMANVCNASVVLGEEQESETNANLLVEVSCKVNSIDEKEFVITTDAFCVNCESVVLKEGLNYSAFSGVNVISDTVASSINISQYPQFDQIKSVLVKNVAISNVSDTESASQIEGVVEVDVLFTNEEGQVDKREGVIPFLLPASNGKVQVANVVAQISNFKIRGTSDLEIIAEVHAEIMQEEDYFINFVSNIELIESESQDDAGIMMYVVKENEDMFDVCRALRVRPEQIEEQNGNKTSVQAGDKIFVYLPKSVDF